MAFNKGALSINCGPYREIATLWLSDIFNEKRNLKEQAITIAHTP